MTSPPTLYPDLDVDSSLLIAQLSLADIRQQEALARGDPDELFSLRVMAEDFETYLRRYQEYQDTLSVAREHEEHSLSMASSHDLTSSSVSGNPVHTPEEDEEDDEGVGAARYSYRCRSASASTSAAAKAESDHSSTSRSSGLTHDWSFPPPLTTADPGENSEEEVSSEDIVFISSQSRSSRSNAAPFSTAIDQMPKKAVECVACTTDIISSSSFMVPPCGHHYCDVCVKQLLRTALTNEKFFPPWCCTPSQRIDLSQFMSAGTSDVMIDDSLVQGLQQKSQEYAVPPKDRVFCPNPSCSTFLGSVDHLMSDHAAIILPSPLKENDSEGESSASNIAECPSCWTPICAECRERAHVGKACQTSAAEFFDDDTEKFLDLAKEQRWQMSNECKRTVEKTSGCNHIVCWCTKEFCYVCGSAWGRCRC